MKKIYFMSLLIISGEISLHCQPTDFGTIYSGNTWSGTSDFITNGNTSVSLSSGYINVTSSTQLNYSNTVYVTGYLTKLSRWKFKARFKVLSFTSNSYGIGFGLKSANANVQNDVFGFVQTSNAGLGRLYILKSDMTVLASGPSLGVALNDVIDVDATLNDSVFTWNAWNLTSGSTASVSYTYVWDGTPKVIPNTSYFSIYELGGIHQIQSLDITSTEKKDANIVVIGDSKSAGYFASSFAGRYAAQLNNIYPVTVINAGGADRVTHALVRSNELLRLAPSKYLLCIGSNDLRFGTSLSALQADYTALTNQLQSSGAQVYHILMPEDYTKAFAVDQTAFKNWLATTYGTNYINGVWDSLASGNRLKGSYDYSDGVHLNQAGNDRVYQALVASGKLNAPVVLPVNLIEFAARRINDRQAELYWKIDDPVEAQRFILQKSSDGIHFTLLKEVIADNRAGYVYLDNADSDKDQFYRLELIDVSGRHSFSRIVYVKGAGSEFVELQKLAGNKIRLLINLAYSQNVSFFIMDINGRIVRQGSFYLQSGQNSVYITIAQLKPSIYYMNVRCKGNRKTIPFVKW